MDLTDKEFNENKLSKYIDGLNLAKEALAFLDKVDLTKEEVEMIESFTYVFSLRGSVLIDRDVKFSMNQKLEQLQSLWALAVAMYALGREHESTREHSSGEG